MVRKCRCVFEAFGGTKQGVEKTSLTYSVNNHTAVKHEPASKIPLDSLQHTVQEYGQKMRRRTRQKHWNQPTEPQFLELLAAASAASSFLSCIMTFDPPG